MSTRLVSIALPLLTGCASDPAVRSLFDGAIGGGRQGLGFSAGYFAYEPHAVRGFGSLSFAGPIGGLEPEYPEGTAAGFGDPRIGSDSDAAGIAAGLTYGLPLLAEGQLMGLFAGPALALETGWAEYDDPTGLLEFGQGSYWEQTGTDSVVGLTVGVHWVREELAIGLSWDSAVGLFAIRFGWTPVL